MTKQEAVQHYGSQKALANALGITQPTIAEWGEFPPPARQYQIERLTYGKLKAEKDVFGKKARKAA